MNNDKYKVPSRDWKRWWLAYGAHFTTGAISGAGVAAAVVTGNPIFALTYLITLQVQVRQIAEYLRRRDTVGRDLGDNLMGFVVSFVLCWSAGRFYFG